MTLESNQYRISVSSISSSSSVFSYLLSSLSFLEPSPISTTTFGGTLGPNAPWALYPSASSIILPSQAIYLNCYTK